MNVNHNVSVYHDNNLTNVPVTLMLLMPHGQVTEFAVHKVFKVFNVTLNHVSNVKSAAARDERYCE